MTTTLIERYDGYDRHRCRDRHTWPTEFAGEGAKVQHPYRLGSESVLVFLEILRHLSCRSVSSVEVLLQGSLDNLLELQGDRRSAILHGLRVFVKNCMNNHHLLSTLEGKLPCKQLIEDHTGRQ